MRRLLLAFSLGAVVVACESAPTALPERASAPEPRPAAEVTQAALTNVPAHRAGSSVCLRYLRERALLVVQLAREPGNSVLVRRGQALGTKLADACN